MCLIRACFLYCYFLSCSLPYFFSFQKSARSQLRLSAFPLYLTITPPPHFIQEYMFFQNTSLNVLLEYTLCSTRIHPPCYTRIHTPPCSTRIPPPPLSFIITTPLCSTRIPPPLPSLFYYNHSPHVLQEYPPPPLSSIITSPPMLYYNTSPPSQFYYNHSPYVIL